MDIYPIRDTHDVHMIYVIFTVYIYKEHEFVGWL